jgi:hypothetical protein
MNDLKKWELKFTKRDQFKAPFKDPPFDPMITFQPKSAQSYQTPFRKVNHSDVKNERNFSNHSKNLHPNKKMNQNRLLPPLPGHSSLSNNGIQIISQRTGRLGLKSDSKPTRSKKAEVLEAMNSSTLAICDKNDLFFESQDNERVFEGLSVKTPTFSGEDEKLRYLSDLSRELKKHQKVKNCGSGLGSKNESIGSFKMSEPSSASKFTAFDSSFSTENPLQSPRNDHFLKKSLISNDKVFSLSSRDHPKIRIRNAGFPKDVFVLKSNN